MLSPYSVEGLDPGALRVPGKPKCNDELVFTLFGFAFFARCFGRAIANNCDVWEFNFGHSCLSIDS